MKRSLIVDVRKATALTVALTAVAAPAAAAQGSGYGTQKSGGYVTHNLVSDQAGMADHMDPNLVNAWGLASRPDSPWWVADNGTNVSTVYTADGAAFPTGSPLVVGVRNAPTGLVANTGSSFMVGSGPALFLFSTEQGKILGWNPSAGSQASVAANRSGRGAIYKGLAISGNRFYATDFHNARVDMFDGSFHLMRRRGAFVDRRIPRGFAPFGIQAAGGRIWVTYAKQDAKREDDVHGRGLGFVDAFSRNGRLLARVARRGALDAPWALAPAPRNFGRFSGDLLVGNFGNGRINAYNLHSGRGVTRAGTLRTRNGKAIAIDGLWSLQFGHGGAPNGPANTLFFTAGPHNEAHGLFGTITAR